MRFASSSWSYKDLMRSRERTRASSSGWLIGLVTKSSAPASMPLMRSVAGSSAVTITTGSVAVAGVSRMRLQTSYPLMPGMTTSSSTRSGLCCAMRSSASVPEAAACHLVALDAEDITEQLHVLRRVVDDQYPGCSAHLKRTLISASRESLRSRPTGRRSARSRACRGNGDRPATPRPFSPSSR